MFFLEFKSKSLFMFDNNIDDELTNACYTTIQGMLLSVTKYNVTVYIFIKYFQRFVLHTMHLTYF